MENKNWGNLTFLEDIARRFKTPLYVYDEEMIRDNYRAFSKAFKSRYPKTKVMYAYKANTNLTICKILKNEGAGADVVSSGELRAALSIGVKPEDIIFTSNSKGHDEIMASVRAGVTINVDSMDELAILEGIVKELGKTARISFRVNPGIDPKTHPKISTGIRDSKFGIHIENDLAFNAYKAARDIRNIKIAGIHTHIGSQIMDLSVFAENAERIMEFVGRLKNELGIELEFVDLGGGLGISYHNENSPTPEDMAKVVVLVIKKWNGKTGYEPQLWTEPGRHIVGNAGILLCRVQSVKKTPYKNFLNVDAGFNTLLRPAMYGAYHKVTVLGKEGMEPTGNYEIAGNLCESGDILASNRPLPDARAGDIIAIFDAGAYGFSMSSQYNSRPRPAEILIRKKSVEIIRERETIDDLFTHQRVLDI